METPQGVTPATTTTTGETAPASSIHRSAWQPSWEKGGRKGKPRMRSNIWVWIVSLLILAVIFVPLGLLAIHVASNLPAFDTAKQFCVDEEDGKYSDAYNLLSDRAQQTITQAYFLQSSAETQLANCAPMQNGAAFNGFSSSVTLQMTYSVPASVAAAHGAIAPTSSSAIRYVTDDNGSMRLVHDSDGWRVDAVTSSLFTLF